MARLRSLLGSQPSSMPFLEYEKRAQWSCNEVTYQPGHSEGVPRFLSVSLHLSESRGMSSAATANNVMWRQTLRQAASWLKEEAGKAFRWKAFLGKWTRSEFSIFISKALTEKLQNCTKALSHPWFLDTFPGKCEIGDALYWEAYTEFQLFKRALL